MAVKTDTLSSEELEVLRDRATAAVTGTGRVAVVAMRGRVLIDFGGVHCDGMQLSLEEALVFARAILNAAVELDSRRKDWDA